MSDNDLQNSNIILKLIQLETFQFSKGLISFNDEHRENKYLKSLHLERNIPIF